LTKKKVTTDKNSHQKQTNKKSWTFLVDKLGTPQNKQKKFQKNNALRQKRCKGIDLTKDFFDFVFLVSTKSPKKK